MKKHWTRSGIMNAAGFALLISAAAVSVVVYLLRYDQLWLWYKVYQEKLLEAEQFIQSLGISWKFVLAMLIVFLVRTFIPFLSVSAICVLTGVVLPSYWALIVNFLGIIIMMSIKYFEGMKFGSGNAWKIISKNERARKIIESSGKVNKALLFALPYPRIPARQRQPDLRLAQVPLLAVCPAFGGGLCAEAAVLYFHGYQRFRSAIVCVPCAPDDSPDHKRRVAFVRQPHMAFS